MEVKRPASCGSFYFHWCISSGIRTALPVGQEFDSRPKAGWATDRLKRSVDPEPHAARDEAATRPKQSHSTRQSIEQGFPSA
jgi:hypothetical protein